MADRFKFWFSGSLDVEQLDLGSERLHRAVGELDQSSSRIANEISRALGEITPGEVNVFITFGEGSIEWTGWVELLSRTWPTIEAMSTLGGAVGLLQLVKAAIDQVLRRWLRRIVGRQSVWPATHVILVSGPPYALRGTGSRPPWMLLGVAAIVTALAAAAAAAGFLVWLAGR